MIVLLQSCELFNLELQRDYEFTPAPVDQYLDMNAYEFILSRKNIDFLYLNTMIEMTQVQNIYEEDGGYTFLLPNDDMVNKWMTGKGKQQLSEISNDEIIDFLRSMVCIGEYSTLGLGTSDVEVQTLKDNAPIYLRVNEVTSVTTSKDEWFDLYINGSNCVITSNLRPTNGVIHVLRSNFNRNYNP